MTEFPPIERIAAAGTCDGPTGLVLVCDHASNAVPPEVTPLGLPDEDMNRHIAFDVGAAGVTRGLAQRLGAPAVLSTWSRLVIDPNRGADDPTLVMKLSDGAIIAGNRDVGPAEVARRLERYYWPYHHAVDAALNDAGSDAVLVSVHSFTPQFRGRPIRPWHVGLLWDHDDRLVAPLLDELRAESDLFIGDNEPYSGQLAGDCMWMHGTQRGIPHVLIEVRNDLIADEDGEEAWADRLAPILTRAIARMRAAP
ncbi:MAG: N-formylglutamate amidohydrolase [Pseudomonadota bacterium]